MLEKSEIVTVPAPLDPLVGVAAALPVLLLPLLALAPVGEADEVPVGEGASEAKSVKSAELAKV